MRPVQIRRWHAMVVCFLGVILTISRADADTASSQAESLTADTGVQNLTMIDGIDRFKRNYFLKKASINMQGWVDDRRILARAFDNPSNSTHPGLEPRAYVVIDTETGAIERMPWNANTDVQCLNNGRIILKERPSGDWRNPETWYVGKFGGAMTTYKVEADATGHHGLPKEWREQGLDLDVLSCQLVKRLTRLKGRVWPEWYKGDGNATYLESEHGWLVEYGSSRTHGTSGEYVLMGLDGTGQDIPISVGERRFNHPSYLSFADGYFTYPELHFGDPRHVWSPHFARLIHPDGRVKRFPIPAPLMDQIINHHEVVRAEYTKSGPLWNLNVHFSNRDSDRLLGDYLIMEHELVRVAQRIRIVSPNGCKLAGDSEWTWQQLNDLSKINDPHDYFVINLCKE